MQIVNKKEEAEKGRKGFDFMTKQKIDDFFPCAHRISTYAMRSHFICMIFTLGTNIFQIGEPYASSNVPTPLPKSHKVIS